MGLVKLRHIVRPFQIGEGLRSCHTEYIEFRDGGTGEDSPVIGRFCGYEYPDDVFSTSNVLGIRFKTESYGRFRATYAQGKQCFTPLHLAISHNKPLTNAGYDNCTSPEDHGCAHECANIFGGSGFECRCRHGFELLEDGKTCESESVSFIRRFCSVIQMNGTRSRHAVFEL